MVARTLYVYTEDIQLVSLKSMDAYDLFRKLGSGAKFDFKRFRGDAERLKVHKLYLPLHLKIYSAHQITLYLMSLVSATFVILSIVTSYRTSNISFIQ